MRLLLSGCEAGVATCLLTNPIWLIKVRMQLQLAEAEKSLVAEGAARARPYRSVADAARTIVREEGFLALYRGLVPALCLVSHGALQFVFYEKLKALATGGGRRELSGAAPLAIGAAAKVLASTATYPWQVVKSRIQQRQVGDVRYDSMLQSASRIWKNEGVRGFYKGIAPNTMRIAPAAAVTFWVYETSMSMLRASDKVRRRTSSAHTHNDGSKKCDA
jgi:solute carrier family 25 folate transporter 32